jgi:hypothetical protein
VVGLPGVTQKSANLGNICHLVLELLAKCKKTNHVKLQDKYSNYEYLLSIVWKRLTKNTPNIVYTDKDYKFCQQQIENVLNSKFNPINLKILDTEKQFEIEIAKPGFQFIDKNNVKRNIKFRGTMDLVTEINEDTIEIIDYKTGLRKSWTTGEMKEYDDFLNDIQLRMYNFATSVIYPHKHRLLTIIFTRDGGPFTVTFTPDDCIKILDILGRKLNEIKNDNYPKRLKDDKSKTSFHWKCKYVCEFGSKFPLSDGRNQCDTYYSFLQKENDLQKSAEQIYSLSVEGRPVLEKISRRNDYGRAKIFKGTYKN